MSTFYAVDAKLDAKYITKNMLHILNKGKIIGFRYYRNILDRSPILDLENILDAALAAESDSMERCIKVIFQDTDFVILFSKSHDEFLKISLEDFGNFTSSWHFNFKNMESIDFARYTRLALRLCKDFTMLELKTYTIE